MSAEDEGARFILVSGRPIGEPVAWADPIVMNAQEELRTACKSIATGRLSNSSTMILITALALSFLIQKTDVWCFLKLTAI